MTDEAKALVERLRDRGVCSIAQNSCRNDYACSSAADLIETQAREIERLRAALENVLAHRYGNWCDIARAALGDSHDQ